jgi:predicted nuclease of predicted toxin-antitoxin system
VRLLLDEDSGARSLTEALRAAGHDVVRVVDVEELGMGASDIEVLNYAVRDDRVLVTKNGSDFTEIIARDSIAHPGVLVVHYQQDGSPLSVAIIAQAIANVGKTYANTRKLVLSVNQHVW